MICLLSYAQKRRGRLNRERSLILFSILVAWLAWGVHPAAAQNEAGASTSTEIEVPPRLVGGAPALYGALTYPDSARVAWIEGTVRVEFTVGVDGEAKEIEIVESVHKLLDTEVCRVIQEMDFVPAQQDGAPVQAQMTLPIRFELQKNSTPTHRATADNATTDSVDNEADAAAKKDLPEQPPELIGGLNSLRREMQYPEQAKREGAQGRVIVEFVVQKDGTPTDVRVIRSVHRLLDAEAVRVIRTLRFVPAKKGEEPVPVDMTMPITFRM